MKIETSFEVKQKVWVIGVTDEVSSKCKCCDNTIEWKNVYSLKEDVIEQIDIHIQENTATMSIHLEDDTSTKRFGSVYLNLNPKTNQWEYSQCYISLSKDDAEKKLKELNKGTEGLKSRFEFLDSLKGKV